MQYVIELEGKDGFPTHHYQILTRYSNGYVAAPTWNAKVPMGTSYLAPATKEGVKEVLSTAIHYPNYVLSPSRVQSAMPLSLVLADFP